MSTHIEISSSFDISNEATLYRGDCLDFLAQVPDGISSLVVTSPPYNIGKEYEQKTTLADYVQWQSQVIAECVRTLKPGGHICWQVGNHVDDGQIFPLDCELYPIFKDLGLQCRNRIIWHFEHGLHCTKRFSGRHETILWFTKGNDYFFDLDPVRVPQKYPGKKHFKGDKKGELSGNPLGKNPSDTWIIPNVKHNHCEKTNHPCQFPVGLVQRLVLSMTEPGDLVVDPFIGSGSTAVAALMDGRKVAGADMMEEYLEIAKERIEQIETGEIKIRPMNQDVYQPKDKEQGGNKDDA